MEHFSLAVRSGGSIEAALTQPTRIGACAILCRGYIADRAQLASEVFGSGEIERSAVSEAGLFAAAYRRWGSGFARHVCGEFSVALYDRATRRLILAHDELGILPLFYTASDRAIRAASHLDELVYETGVGTLDETYLSEYLLEQRHYGERTPYAHIQRVIPGETVIWTDGRLERQAVWTLGSGPPVRYRDPRDYEVRLRDTIKRAVDSSLVTNAKMWCELSGGLDSSTVYAEAVASGHERVEAFSLVYPESHSADEQKWIRPVLERFPRPWFSLNADTAKPFGDGPERFAAQPRIALVTAGWDRAYDRLLAEHDVDFVLTGQGGDAVLLGDAPKPFYLADLLRRGALPALWRELGTWSANSPQGRPPGYFLRRYAFAGRRRMARRQLLDFSPPLIPWLSPRLAQNATLRAQVEGSNVPPHESVGTMWFLESVLRSAHVVCSQYGERDARCCFRHPLLYRPLVQYMAQVPWEVKLRAGYDRILQRRAYERVLPEATVLRRNKMGPDQAFYSGLATNPAMVERLTRDPQVVARGYVLADAWRRAVEQAASGSTPSIRWFLATASLELWLGQLDRARRP